MVNREGLRPQTVQNLLDQLFQIAVETRDGGIDVTASTTVEQFLRANPSRVAFTFVNLGINPVFIWSDEQVSASRGLRAGPNGGSITVIYDQDFARVGYAWFMVATGGASNVAIMEELIGS